MFNENLLYLEDTELGERLSHHGLRILYNPEALGYHLHELKEADYLAIAPRLGTALARWYRAAPDRLDTLGSLGLPEGMSAKRRLRLRFAETFVDPLAKAPLRVAARAFAERNDGLAMTFYRKLFEIERRAALREELVRTASR